jgi:hypothetical protein
MLPASRLFIMSQASFNLSACDRDDEGVEEGGCWRGDGGGRGKAWGLVSRFAPPLSRGVYRFSVAVAWDNGGVFGPLHVVRLQDLLTFVRFETWWSEAL